MLTLEIKYTMSFQVRTISAHQTPRMMLDYASSAQQRGIRIIIAGDSGAAHLPGRFMHYALCIVN